MKIAMRTGKDGQWQEMSSNDHGDDRQADSHVQEFIRLMPEIIPVEGMGIDRPPLRVCIRSLTPGGVESDIGFVGVDENGGITIVGCKPVNDSSARREVIGQAIEYAIGLSEMSYEELDAVVSDCEGKPLVELMQERVPEEEWSEEEFKRVIVSTLQQGRFRLIVAVQGMTDKLEQTVRFLNASGPFSFETYAMQMHRFTNGQIEVIIPEMVNLAGAKQETSLQTEMPVHEASRSLALNSIETSDVSTASVVPGPTGTDSEKAKPPPETSAQKVASFLAKCRETVSTDGLGMIKRLYTLSKEAADDIIWWGAGGSGAFNFVVTADELTVFIVDANGKIMFNFSDWQRDTRYQDLLPQFIERLKGIAILNKQREDYTSWPDFGIEEFFAEPNDFIVFRESVNLLKEELDKLGA